MKMQIILRVTHQPPATETIALVLGESTSGGARLLYIKEGYGGAARSHTAGLGLDAQAAALLRDLAHVDAESLPAPGVTLDAPSYSLRMRLDETTRRFEWTGVPGEGWERIIQVTNLLLRLAGSWHRLEPPPQCRQMEQSCVMKPRDQPQRRRASRSRRRAGKD